MHRRIVFKPTPNETYYRVNVDFFVFSPLSQHCSQLALRPWICIHFQGNWIGTVMCGGQQIRTAGRMARVIELKKGRKNFLRHEPTRSQCHHKIDTPHCFLITPTAPIVFPIICPSDIMQTFPILPPLARPQMCYILISFPRKICSALVQIQLAGLMKVAKGYDVYWFSLFTFD